VEDASDNGKKAADKNRSGVSFGGLIRFFLMSENEKASDNGKKRLTRNRPSKKLPLIEFHLNSAPKKFVILSANRITNCQFRR
jgi:hypothetical protein